MVADLAHSFGVQPPVAATRIAGSRPVVALESTFIAHGMPYPENVRTAREVEALVRDPGADPATIALNGGRIRIGLSNDELERLLARALPRGRLWPASTGCVEPQSAMKRQSQDGSA